MCAGDRNRPSATLSLMAHKAGLQGHSKTHLDGCGALMSALEASPQTRHFVIATVMGQWEDGPSHQRTSPLLCFYTELFDSYLRFSGPIVDISLYQRWPQLSSSTV